MKAKIIIIVALLCSMMGLAQSGEKFDVVQLRERGSAPTSATWGDGSMYFSTAKELFIKKNGTWTLVGAGDAIQDGSNNTNFWEIRTNGLNGFELGIDGPTGGTDYVRINGGETVGEAPLLYITDNRVALSNYSISDINSVGALSLITKEYADATYGGGGSGDMAKATYDVDDDGKVDKIDDGTSNITNYLQFISSITNKIELGESDPIFGTNPWIRLTAGNQTNQVTMYLTDNRATLEGYSDSEINSQGAASLVTKGYGDNNWAGADWDTNLANIPVGFADGVDNDTQLSDPEVETAYDNQVPVMTQVEAEGGTSTEVRRITAQRLKQAIDQFSAQTALDLSYSNNGQENVEGALNDLYTSNISMLGINHTGDFTIADSDIGKIHNIIVNAPDSIVVTYPDDLSVFGWAKFVVDGTGFVAFDMSAMTTTGGSFKTQSGRGEGATVRTYSAIKGDVLFPSQLLAYSPVVPPAYLYQGDNAISVDNEQNNTNNLTNNTNNTLSVEGTIVDNGSYSAHSTITNTTGVTSELRATTYGITSGDVVLVTYKIWRGEVGSGNIFCRLLQAHGWDVTDQQIVGVGTTGDWVDVSLTATATVDNPPVQLMNGSFSGVTNIYYDTFNYSIVE